MDFFLRIWCPLSQGPFCRAASLDNIQLLILDNQDYEILKDRGPQFFQDRELGLTGSRVRQASEFCRVTSELEVFAKIPFLNLNKTKSNTLKKEPFLWLRKISFQKHLGIHKHLKSVLRAVNVHILTKMTTPPPPHKEKHERNH